MVDSRLQRLLLARFFYITIKMQTYNQLHAPLVAPCLYLCSGHRGCLARRAQFLREQFINNRTIIHPSRLRVIEF